jgi:hypothetical protein
MVSDIPVYHGRKDVAEQKKNHIMMMRKWREIEIH